MSDIDFQNGFIVGMATRGLTVSRTVIEGDPGIILAPYGGYIIGAIEPTLIIQEVTP